MRNGIQAKIGATLERKVYAVDLFCGAGGLTHGLMKAGVDVRLGVDIDPACEYPYVANNNAKFLLKSVEELEASELERHYRKNGIKLLAGCAPCQTFSTYNQKATDADKRWWLLLQFSRLVDELSPDRPLLLNMTFYGLLPYYGVSYVDDSGETISYSINMSGKDGSVILTEFLPYTQ